MFEFSLSYNKTLIIVLHVLFEVTYEQKVAQKWPKPDMQNVMQKVLIKMPAIINLKFQNKR